MGRVLSIEIVVLATSAAILLVRSCDLENRNSGLLHETEKACAIAASRLYTDVLQVTECPHPGEHMPVALTGGGEGSRFDNPILLIHHRCDVKILMGIHAADDATCSFVYRHSPLCLMAKRRRRKRQWTLTSMAAAPPRYRPHIRPGHPGDRPHDQPHAPQMPRV